MPHEVRMPQLGMTQESGVIVSWLKTAGDAVAEGDALFEVETDKATMEVEAQTGGFLAAIKAAEGDDVPVGEVIALLVESESEVAAHGARPSEPATEQPTQKQAVAARAEQSPAPQAGSSLKPVPPVAPPVREKVLASPKAKRLALEKGIDLADLRAQGVPEPIHAADLSKAATGGHSALSASVAGAALNALLASSDTADRAALFAAFAAGAWRALFNAEAGILLRATDGTTRVIGKEPAALVLVDLCATRLSGYAPASGGTTLSAAQQGDGYTLTLSFRETTLPLAQAAALLDEVAARVEDPIRQLL